MPQLRPTGLLGPTSANEHFAAIVASSDDAILSKDADGIVTSWNPAAERMYGYSADEAVGSHISMLIPPHRAGEEREILDQILQGSHVSHYETERVTKEGRQINVSLSVSPIRGEHGEIEGASVIARDVTRRERSLALASRLQQVADALARESTRDKVIDVLLGQMVGALGAQAGAVALVDDTDVVVTDTTGYSSEGLSGWMRFPLAADVPMATSIRTGEAIWTTTAAELTERFPALSGLEVRFEGLAILPLAVGGAPFGCVSLSFTQSHDFDPEERAFLVAASQQAAYALNRAQMYEAERLTGERQRFLAEASELMSTSLDPEATLDQLAALAVRHIADWCGVEMTDGLGGLHSVVVAHADESRVEIARRLREKYPVDPRAETGVPNVIRTGQTEVYPEVTDEMLSQAARDENHLALLRELGLRSAMIVPLRARGRVFGAITFVASSPERRYGDADVQLAEDLARRAALAVDNAMLFHREHEAAVVLQRSLLPDSVPKEHKGIEFDVRYRPAGPGVEVGGDWYDIVLLDDGSVGLTIGDVAGRGIKAASVMGRIRPALRAYVLDGHGPAEALERLDRLMKENPNPQMTTLFHLHFDPQSATAAYVRAGHPPALLRHPDGAIEELGGAGTPPLGILEEVTYEEHTVAIPPGSLLVMYTDGLIERRHTTLSEELARLKDVFAEAPPGARDCLDWLEENVDADEIPDDIAMVAMTTPG
ncbi:MAG: SpoIIE family protein phosphatase [Actinomycetota bacterium]|nr:SpoIIE family protein phosphatase [Actinomycetota bacterium]